MKTNTKVIISVTLVITMIASATFVGAKGDEREQEQNIDLESRFIGIWQFDTNWYNPYGEDSFFFYDFNEDGTYRLYGIQRGQNISIVGKWYVSEETKELFLSNNQRGIDYVFSKDGKTLTLNALSRSAIRFNKIVIEVSDPQPIIITPPDTPIQIPIPVQEPNDIVVMSLGDTFHPGTVSGVCMMVGQIHYRCPCVSLELYIDGELHSIQDNTIRSIWFEGIAYSGYLFEDWDTTEYENGLHQLKIIEENGRVAIEMLVLVQN